MISLQRRLSITKLLPSNTSWNPLRKNWLSDSVWETGRTPSQLSSRDWSPPWLWRTQTRSARWSRRCWCLSPPRKSPHLNATPAVWGWSLSSFWSKMMRARAIVRRMTRYSGCFPLSLRYKSVTGRRDGRKKMMMNLGCLITKIMNHSKFLKTRSRE